MGSALSRLGVSVRGSLRLRCAVRLRMFAFFHIEERKIRGNQSADTKPCSQTKYDRSEQSETSRLERLRHGNPRNCRSKHATDDYSG